MMVRLEPPVLVNCTERVLDGWVVVSFFSVPKFRFAGMILTVPFVRVITAVVVLVVSATDVAVTLTLAFVGTLLGAANDAVAPLGVRVPHAEVQAVAIGLPWVRVQVTP